MWRLGIGQAIARHWGPSWGKRLGRWSRLGLGLGLGFGLGLGLGLGLRLGIGLGLTGITAEVRIVRSGSASPPAA